MGGVSIEFAQKKLFLCFLILVLTNRKFDDIILIAINSYLGCDFIKNTIQKEAVTHALFALDHPTADEVFDCVHSEYPTVSKATVYRILNRMADDGEILHLSVPSGPDRFDTTLSEHHHIKCTVCGKVCDISLPELPEIEKRITEESGFAVSRRLIFFEGICPSCQNKR